MLGGLISAGTQLIGGLLGRSESGKSRQMAAEQFGENLNLQRDLANHSIRWRVEDAKRAGIHPLYALGAPPVSGSLSPTVVGADMSMSNAVANMGQDLGRAINSTRTASERELAVKQTALQLDGLKLDNDIKRATLASSLQRLQQNANPPIPEGTPDNRPALFMGGEKIGTDPFTSNTEDYSRRYGEPGEWFYAPQVWWEDFKYRNRDLPSATQMMRGRFGDPPKWLQLLMTGKEVM